jgi:hypothetical protein
MGVVLVCVVSGEWSVVVCALFFAVSFRLPAFDSETLEVISKLMVTRRVSEGTLKGPRDEQTSLH